MAQAKNAKAAVVFAWSTGSLATPLPEGQDQLIADVAAVNPDTVVVLNTSDPVAMPWLGSVKAVPGDVVSGRYRRLRDRERAARQD